MVQLSFRTTTLATLKNENFKLKDELLLESKYSTLPSNPAATAQIAKLQDQAGAYTRPLFSST
jgi:hypothetical protein